MKKVVIGVATRGADIFHKTILWLTQQYARQDISVSIVFSECSLSVIRAHEQLLDCMNDLHADYCMFVDADVCPTFDTLDKLMAPDKDIVTSPAWHYDRYTDDIHLNVHYDSIDPEVGRIYRPKDGGLERIYSTSLAATMFKMSVFDRFRDAGESTYKWSPLIDESFKENQPDCILFAKAKKLGIETWVNWDIKGLQHFQRTMLSTYTIERLFAKTGRKIYT